jgi:hypothetical protein
MVLRIAWFELRRRPRMLSAYVYATIGGMGRERTGLGTRVSSSWVLLLTTTLACGCSASSVTEDARDAATATDAAPRADALADGRDALTSHDAPRHDEQAASTDAPSEREDSGPGDATPSREDVRDAARRDAPADAKHDHASLADASAGGQSLVWVWVSYPQSLAAAFAHPESFTQIAPCLYNLNYSYTSGVAEFSSYGAGDDFDGLTSSQIASQVHVAGMQCVPLIGAGAGNSGVDQGIQNILSDSPAGTQSAFIGAMVGEAVNKGYDGYDLDWEVGSSTDYASYGQQLTSFLGAFQSALHAHDLTLEFIVGDWFIRQSDCSGDTGFVDLMAVSAVVDQVIVMDYAASLGSPASVCPASQPNPAPCGGDFASDLDLTCALVPMDKVSIAFDSDPSAGDNDIAGAAVAATKAYGVRNVAIWPEYNMNGPDGGYAFCDTTNISPAGATWFALLAEFVSP